MTGTRESLFFTILLLSIVLFASTAVRASDVLPGYDCFTVPPGAGSYYSFSDNPIPAGFFGIGSDPFDGTIAFVGQHVDTDPPGVLGPTDVIIRRLDTATFGSCDVPDQIPIEIVSLNLVSVSPIRITFYGFIPTYWYVDMCLSSQPQPQGTMSLTHSCDAGGTLFSNLPMLPRLRFTKTDDPEIQGFLDFGIEQRPAVLLESGTVNWTHTSHGLMLLRSPGGITVDHDCDGTSDVTVGGGSNFFGGLIGSPCDCNNEPVGYEIQTFYLQSADQAARIGLVPAEGQASVPTLSQWGMLIMGLLLLATGTVTILGRRKSVAADAS